MTVMGPTAFAVLLWGVLLVVSLVFVYEAYAIADEYGWIDRTVRRSNRTDRGGEQ